MFARITTNCTPARPNNALDEFGAMISSDWIVSLNEFTYKSGTEIFVRKNPPNTFSKSKRARFEATNCSRMVGARLAHFTWSAIYLAWKTVPCIDLTQRRSSIRLFDSSVVRALKKLQPAIRLSCATYSA